MTSQTLTELRSAIARICPEIMELSFGCRIRDFEKVKTVIKFRIDPEKENYWIDFLDSDTGFVRRVTKLELEMRNGFEILGHPIQLHHVLRAIRAVDKAIKVNENGRMQLEEPVKYTAATEKKAGTFPTHWVGCDYNLLFPLDEQGPETIDFLHSIICKRNTK